MSLRAISPAVPVGGDRFAPFVAPVIPMFPLALQSQWAGVSLRRLLSGGLMAHGDRATLLEDSECLCGLAFPGAIERVYNEEAFRHFLALERTRAEVSGRPFVLVLVSLGPEAGSGLRIEEPVAERMFRALHSCVREIDFIGWFREGRLAAAVLPQGPEGVGADVPSRIRARVTQALCAGVPRQTARRVRVRVLEVGGRAKC
jgi:hypothetical protein